MSMERVEDWIVSIIQTLNSAVIVLSSGHVVVGQVFQGRCVAKAVISDIQIVGI